MEILPPNAYQRGIMPMVAGKLWKHLGTNIDIDLWVPSLALLPKMYHAGDKSATLMY